MTAETVVKVEGVKCEVEMKNTCDDPSRKSLGGGGGDVCECNGGGGDSKDDYVFVNDSDVASDHGETEENGGESIDNVSESIADLQGSVEGGNGDRIEFCNGVSGKVDDNVVKVDVEELKVQNLIVSKEENELVKENGEIKVEKEGVIEDKEVIVEKGDNDDNEGEVYVKDRDLEIVEENDVKSNTDEEKGVEEGDECNASIDGIGCPSLDNDDNFDDGSDKLQNGSAVVEVQQGLPSCGIEEEVQIKDNEICTKEGEKIEDGVRKPEVNKDRVDFLVDEVLVNKSESMHDVLEESNPVEVDVVLEDKEDDHMGIEPPDGETKASDIGGAEKLLPDDEITEKQSSECELQDLQPVPKGQNGLVETEVEISVQGDLGSSDVGVEDLASLDSKAIVIVENQDVRDLTLESEECEESQGVPEQAEGAVDEGNLASTLESEEHEEPLGVPDPTERADNERNLASTAPELDGSAPESTGQCDETTMELTEEITGTIDASTVSEQSEKFDKPLDDQELDTSTVSDHEEGTVDVTAQVERTLECILQEASSEDVSLNNVTTAEETVNSSLLNSAHGAVVAMESKHMDDSDLENGVVGNSVTALEPSHDSRSCLTSEVGDLSVSSDSQLDLHVPQETDVIEEPETEDNHGGSYVGKTSFEANVDNRDGMEVKPANDDIHDLSKESCEGTLTFGSFVCQTKSNGVLSTLADANVQIITDGVPASPLEGSAVSTCLSDANPQTITDGVSESPMDGSQADAADGKTANSVRSPFCWLIKVPRLDDVEFEKIKRFQTELDKKTQDRDDYRKVLLNRMDVFQEVKDKFHAAKAEERNTHQLMMAKKREIDSAQSLLKLARDGNTVERIDGQILNMDRRIQHETMNLAEEKRLIREIKLLNNQRERLAADTQGQQEVHQAVGRRVETEEQLKVLRKEMDALRDDHSKAFERLKVAERKYEEESIARRKLEAERDSLARIRQDAYEHFLTLKKEAFEKNKPCYNYRDAKKAILNVKAGELENLEQICVNQVENFMELWNKNDDFRKEYIRCNKRSTLRRFNTLDGRDLGIDEKKPLLEDFSVNGVALANLNSVATPLTLEREFPAIAKKAKEEDSSGKVAVQKNTNALAKKRGELTSNNSVTEPSGRTETEEEEGPKLTKEEEEMAKKAEQKRKEEEAERLKEQRRLEEKAKAQEALERKKRMAEKAQARAKFKAEKEAEEKRKAMEKRAKKKGKKGTASESPEVEPAQVPESSSETTREPGVTEKPVNVVKKSHKPAALYTKQVKTIKSIPAPPAPLRNKSKRRIPQWVWWLALAVLSALLIFPLGNIDIVGLLKPLVFDLYK